MTGVERATRGLAITLTVWSALYISRSTEYAGLVLAPAQNQAIFLGLVLALAFLSFPAKKGMQGVKWYDWIFVVMGVVPNAYVALFYDTWILHGGTEAKIFEIVFSLTVTIAILEGLRRVLGIILPIILLGFILHPIFSNYLPGILSGRGYSITRVGEMIYFPPEGVFSMPLNIAATIVVGFLIFGGLLLVSGAGEIMTDLALSVVGRVRGGAAKAAIIGSAMFGTLSGSPSANVAVTGTFTIPMMKRSGYKPEFAGGVEASASNGGQLMPPVMGAVAFVMADMLEIPYFEICYIAFIPAVLYYFCMFMQIDLEAARLGIGGLPSSEVPLFLSTLKAGWPYFIPVIVLVYLLFGIKYSPELSSFWAAVSVLLLGIFRKRSRLKTHQILDSLEATGRNVVQIGLACAMAGIMMASLSLTGVAVSLSGEIVRIAGNSVFFLLLLSAITSFILGMGMPSIPCYIFVSVMVAPALTNMGIWVVAAHFFVLWFGIGSFITPPVCMAAYVAAAVARVNPMKVAWRATLVGIGNFVIPFLFIYTPALLLKDSVPGVVLAILFAGLGMVALSTGISGYFLRRIGWLERALLIGSAVTLFFPSWWSRLVGLGVLGISFVWEKRSLEKKKYSLV
jgi:TRAP transporter 4TM/12TM fusion protein